LSGIENFIGGAGNDSITGTAVANALSGGAGNDTLIGGRAQDMLTGGLGADTFDYNSAVPILTNVGDSGVGAANRDIITDFVSGTDKLDFSSIDANAGIFGNQAFSGATLVASSGGFSAAGQLHYFYETVAGQEYTVVEGNVGLGNDADFQVALVGHHTLQASDIVL
jgi:Ca2+-binding RTX toxin-like protein